MHLITIIFVQSHPHRVHSLFSREFKIGESQEQNGFFFVQVGNVYEHKMHIINIMQERRRWSGSLTGIL